MTVKAQIKDYISTLPDVKRKDIETLQELVLSLNPSAKLWFLDGKNEQGKIVSNPNIGYGFQTMHYADGTSRHFYQIGLSANTSGISVYIMGIEDKKYLPDTYGKKIGKATVTGYCIKFKALKDIDIEVLKNAISDGLEATKQ